MIFGLVGANFRTVLNNTIIPVIRGNDNVGGLIGFNYHTAALNLEPELTEKDYRKAITKAMFPAVYVDGVASNIYSLSDEDFYNDIFNFIFHKY